MTPGIAFVLLLDATALRQPRLRYSRLRHPTYRRRYTQEGAISFRLRTTDALQAGRLQDELDTLREDVIYLKVKLREELA